MLFRHARPNDAVQRALRAAVAFHRPVALRALLASHGERVFARALSDLSSHVIVDTLSMLSAQDHAQVWRRLSRAARRRLREADARHRADSLYARSAASASPLFLLR